MKTIQKLLMFLTLLFLFSCEGIALSHAQDVSTMRLQTVLVRDNKGLGAGWVYDRNHIITDNHVVDSDVVDISFFGRDSSVKGRVVRRWKGKDVALVEVNIPSSILIPSLRCTKLMYGEPISIIGMPLGLPWILSKGYVASDIINETGDLVVVDASITHGNSGGPVFDASGRVVGMSEATAVDENKEGYPLSLITPSETICNLLKGN